MKRVFGTAEVILDIVYLAAALAIGLILLLTAADNLPRLLAGLAALFLVGGDAFHLAPRLLVIKTGQEAALRRQLGRGKKMTSITMTIFYLFLWQIGILLSPLKGINIWTCGVYGLATIRIFLSLLPHNRWEEQHPPLKWGIWRNIPFFMQGALVAGLFFLQKNIAPGLALMWLLTGLSFAFYIPVVLGANKYPKIGMLMLPKTYIYLWILAMCLSL